MCEEIKKEPEVPSEESPSASSEPKTTLSQAEQVQDSRSQGLESGHVQSEFDEHSTLSGQGASYGQFPGEEPNDYSASSSEPPAPTPTPRPIIPFMVLGLLLVSIGLGFSLSAAPASGAKGEAVPTPAFLPALSVEAIPR